MEISGQYLTYNEYQGLGGTLDQMPFNLLEFEARQIIDKYTLGKLKELDTQNQEVKLCDYKLINALEGYTQLETQNKGVASESIDGYSISYTTMGSNEIMAKNSELSDIVRTYLIDCKLEDGTPYLYRGAE